MNILEALQNKELFGDAFIGESWEAWRAVLSGAFALPMDDNRKALFKQLSGGRKPPTQRVRELYCIAGRRSAKTHTAAGMAVYLATVGAALEGLTDKLAPGERGVIALLATDRSQAKVALNYIMGMFDSSPVLAGMVQKRGSESIELNNRVTIEINTSNFRSIRGRTLLAVLLDECAFFRDIETSAANDQEIYRAAVPGLATTGGLLIAISSPYAKRGLLYDKYKRHYGKDSDTLVVKGPTTLFNPTLDPKIIEDALEEDPEAAKTEWLGEFRAGITSFIDPEVVTACTVPGRIELAPATGTRYAAFTDPSGGSKDSWTLAISHKDGDQVVIDALRAVKPPFSPAAVVDEFASLLSQYGIKKVTGDRFGGEFPRELFRKQGIDYELSDRPASDLYRDSLPLLNSGRVELLDNKQLRQELIGLERMTSRVGKDRITHASNAHDDLANSAMGAVIEANKPVTTFIFDCGGDTSEPFTIYGNEPARGGLAPESSNERLGRFGSDSGLTFFD